MVISSAMSFWPEYKNDFLISFLINFINAVIGYVVSKKYFNAINSIFYTMIYGSMFLRFILMLMSMLILILNGFVNMIPFFLSFMVFYVLFQIFEINSLLMLNKVSND
tara:strand:- start:133 stop:456 length:324 start_codon:yes stop_codon:yes gene_type:complete